jgi:putative acetyltransferase
MNLTFAAFTPQDQSEARELILRGLGEHWGWIDPSRNPDLEDIAFSYSQAWFIVVRCGGVLVGTGALVPRSPEEAEIVRMSVDQELRRQGVGRQILDRLVEEARGRGFRRIILETTATWKDVIAFYLAYGFRITHDLDGDVYFVLELDAEK